MKTESSSVVDSAGSNVAVVEVTADDLSVEQLQKVRLTDKRGTELTPLTEATGQLILEELRQIRRCQVALCLDQIKTDPSEQRTR